MTVKKLTKWRQILPKIFIFFCLQKFKFCSAQKLVGHSMEHDIEKNALHEENFLM